MSEARRCESSGCNSATREGKAHCPDHVHDNPYVKIVLAQIEVLTREREQERATANGAIAHEIMVALRQRSGKATIERIASLTGIPVEDLGRTVAIMAKLKRVRLSHTNRGRLVVQSREQS